jgi:hypothetical protein
LKKHKQRWNVIYAILESNLASQIEPQLDKRVWNLLGGRLVDSLEGLIWKSVGDKVWMQLFHCEIGGSNEET